jgi:hypothetical protein
MLFVAEVKTICSNPIGFTLDRVDDKAQKRGSESPPQATLGIEKYDVACNYGIGFKTGHDGFLFDAADGMLARLPGAGQSHGGSCIPPDQSLRIPDVSP